MDNINAPVDPLEALEKRAAERAALIALEAVERERRDRLEVAIGRMREYCTRSDIGDPDRRIKLADELLNLAGVLKELELADRHVIAMQQFECGRIALAIMREALAGDRATVAARLERVAGLTGSDQVDVAHCLQDVGGWYWHAVPEPTDDAAAVPASLSGGERPKDTGETPVDHASVKAAAANDNRRKVLEAMLDRPSGMYRPDIYEVVTGQRLPLGKRVSGPFGKFVTGMANDGLIEERGKGQGSSGFFITAKGKDALLLMKNTAVE